MTTLPAFLARIAAALDGAGIPWMLTGSVASTHFGRPRTTHDVDFVIDPDGAALARFVRIVQADDLYADADSAADALRRRRQFNVIDPHSGWKADLIVRKERPFSREEFARRGPARLQGVGVSIATPEDVVLAKLEWSRRGESAQQLEDAAGIVAVWQDRLDVAYIERWARELGVLDLWERVRD